jgi:hypothetical protein
MTGESITILNAGGRHADADADIAASLHQFLLTLQGRYFDSGRRGIDYVALAHSDDFARLRRMAALLAAYPLEVLHTPAQRLAFWLNTYNALYLHGIIERGVRDTVLELRDFSVTTGYVVGGLVFTPRDIEYGILRGNRPCVMHPLGPFGAGDPRLALAMPHLDARIHFAMVCGTRSCAPIRVYSAQEIDAQLELAARSYLNAEVEVIPERPAVVLPMIFYWFWSDFEDGQPLGEFLLRYLDDGRARSIVEKLDRVEVLFRRWDYDLNQM